MALPPRLCFQGFQGFTSRRPPTPRACPRRWFHRSLPKPTSLRARQEVATDALVGFFKEGLVIHHYLGVRLNGPRTGPLPPFTPCKARSNQSSALRTSRGGPPPPRIMAPASRLTLSHPRLPRSAQLGAPPSTQEHGARLQLNTQSPTTTSLRNPRYRRSWATDLFTPTFSSIMATARQHGRQPPTIALLRKSRSPPSPLVEIVSGCVVRPAR